MVADTVAVAVSPIGERAHNELRKTDGNSAHQEVTGPHCVLPNGRGIALLHGEGLEFYGTGKYSERNRVALDNPLCAVADPRSGWLIAGQAGQLQRLPLRWNPNRLGINPGRPVNLPADVQRVTSLALSADGKFLAVGDEGRGQLRVHPLSADATAVLPAIATVTMDNVEACALSPDGRWLAAGSQVPATTAVWRTEDTARVTALAVAAAASAHDWHPVFSEDGRWLALSGRTCQLYAAGTWEPGPALDLPPNGSDNHGAAFYCPASQPGLCLLAVVAGDREIHLFRLLPGSPLASVRLAVLRLPGEPFVSLPAFDDHGKLTIALPRARLATWNLTELQKELRELNLDW